MISPQDAPTLATPVGSVSRRRAALSTLIFTYINAGIALVNGIILVPLYLNHFALGVYGAWLASGNAISLLGVLDAGLNTVVAQRLGNAAGNDDQRRFARIATAGLALGLFSAILIVAIGVGFSTPVVRLVHTPPHAVAAVSMAFSLSAIGTAASFLQLAFVSMLRAWQLTAAAGLSQVIGSAAGLIATVIGMRSGLGVVALGLGAAVRGIIGLAIAGAAVVHEWVSRGMGRPMLDRNEVGSLGWTGAPIFVGRIASVVMSNSESAIISIVINPESAAILSITQRVYTVCVSFLSPIYSSAFAGIAHIAAKENVSRVRAVLAELLGLMSVASALMLGGAVALNANFIHLWLGSEQFGGPYLNILCCLAVLVVTRLTAMANFANALGVIASTTLPSMVELVVRFILLYYFMMRWGILGIPLATIVGSGVVGGVTYVYFLHRKVGGGLALSRVGLPLILIGVGLGVTFSLLLDRPRDWIDFLVQCILVGSALAALVTGASPIVRVWVRNLYSRLSGIVAAAI